jgi:hypothetical protein
MKTAQEWRRECSGQIRIESDSNSVDANLQSTKFVLDGKDSTVESVHLGNKVWVDMHEDRKTGDLVAHKVVGGIV